MCKRYNTDLRFNIATEGFGGCWTFYIYFLYLAYNSTNFLTNLSSILATYSA